MQFIDLSVPINKSTPVFPGDSPVKLEPGGILEKDGYEDHYLNIGTHIGTHIDAPSHMIKGGKTLAQIPLEQFLGRGIHLKIDENFDVNIIRKADIKPGDIVLFQTGMDTMYDKPEYFSENPEMSGELAHYLVSKKVKMVGVDACSIDREPYPIHKMLLGNNILLIENLTNLESLKGKNFNVYALPLKLQVDGSPARVIAEIF